MIYMPQDAAKTVAPTHPARCMSLLPSFERPTGPRRRSLVASGISRHHLYGNPAGKKAGVSPARSQFGSASFLWRCAGTDPMHRL